MSERATGLFHNFIVLINPKNHNEKVYRRSDVSKQLLRMYTKQSTALTKVIDKQLTEERSIKYNDLGKQRFQRQQKNARTAFGDL